jgi:hypothetical protein
MKIINIVAYLILNFSEAYHELLIRISGDTADSPAAPAPLDPLNREDYPQVKFWFKCDWLAYQPTTAEVMSNGRRCSSGG